MLQTSEDSRYARLRSVSNNAIVEMLISYHRDS